ncbi:MAG: bifunctional nuclease family protein [Cyclobacteriaceae bacterium]|nr:bifunctional nuclease family protein [Cyclobacteriaceae bacterium]
MDKIKLDILGLSSSQSQSGSFALVLGEEKGDRRLPIIIGMFEAQAIAIEIEKIIPNRPMTHDLFKSFAHQLDFTVEEIIIYDLKEGVFFARIVCKKNTLSAGQGAKTIEIDSRPSDAIAIGLRFGAKIYTYEKILEEAGVVLSEDDAEIELKESPKKTKEHEVAPIKNEKKMKDFSIKTLNKMLNNSIEKEDYEQAAQIRDELSKRN